MNSTETPTESPTEDRQSPFIAPSWKSPGRVRALVTTRTGGYSASPFDRFNLALHVGDAEAEVQKNRKLLANTFDRLQICWLNQVHGSRVVDAGQGRAREADAIYTRKSGLACAVMVADCLPILICDKAGLQVAAAHGGWRGLAAGVVEAAVRRFPDPADLMAWLGPAIGPCHFEVGSEVKDAFRGHEEQFAPGSRPGKWMMDLYGVARERLTALGVAEVYGGDLCTFCDPARFYSHRRDGLTGRMAAMIWIADEKE